MKPIRPIFTITAAVWLLLQSCGVHAQPGAAIDAQFTDHDAKLLASAQADVQLAEKQAVLGTRVDDLAAAVAAIPEAFGTVVPWFDRDMSADIRAAFAYQLTSKRPTWFEGERYKISGTITLPSVWGFNFSFPAASIEGNINSSQVGIGGAFVWVGPVDSTGPMIEATCTNGRFGCVCLLGRERDNQPVPSKLVGWAWRRPTVPAGKSQFGLLRCGDMAIGVQCGAPGDSDGHHCDNLSYDTFEAFGVQSAYELNNEQSMGHHLDCLRVGNCPRLFDVWGGGVITVDAGKVLTACKAITIRKAIEANDPEGRPPRPVSVGSSNGSFTLNGFKCDRQTEGGFQALDMERDATVLVTLGGLHLPDGATLLVDAKGGANVTVSGRGLSANSIRMAGVERKNPTTGLKEFITPYTAINGSKIGGTSGAALMTADSHHCTLEWDKCTGGFSNERIEPGFETRK